VENQHFAEERIPLLLATPAAVRWISAEPLLGPVDLSSVPHSPMVGAPRLDWVICGGESGPNARPMHPDWARSLRDECQRARVPFFFKQWGQYAPCAVCCGNNHVHESIRPDGVMARVGKKKAGRLLDGREWNEFPT
jgi:protein gp37